MRRVLGSLVLVVTLVSSGTASAQTPGVVYTRAVQEPPAFTFRLADASPRWIALERDRDLVSQEVLVLDARDGSEVLRAPGLALPPSAPHTVSETFDLTVRPFLSGDRVLSFVDADTLVARALPGGAELWRARVPAVSPLVGAFVVGEHRVAWSDATSLHVLDAATGTELWRAAIRPWASGGHVAVASDDRVAAWDADGSVIAWDASGHETARVAQPIDYGAAGLFFAGTALVTVGSNVTWFEPLGGRVLEAHPCADSCAAIDAGTHVVVVDVDGAFARPDGGGPVVRIAGLADAWLHEASGGLLAVSESGVATLLDATGTVRARLSVGVSVVRWLYRPRSRVLVARGALAGQDVIVRVDPSGALEARSLAAPAPTPRRIVVAGVLRVNRRARSGVPITIGGVRVRTGADGRFRARVELTGPILLRITREDLVRAAHRPCASDLEEVVEVPETGESVHLRLEAQAYGYECDRACRCD